MIVRPVLQLLHMRREQDDARDFVCIISRNNDVELRTVDSHSV